MATSMSSWFFGNHFLLPRGNDAAGQKISMRDCVKLEKEDGEGTETSPGKGGGGVRVRTCRLKMSCGFRDPRTSVSRALAPTGSCPHLLLNTEPINARVSLCRRWVLSKVTLGTGCRALPEGEMQRLSWGQGVQATPLCVCHSVSGPSCSPATPGGAWKPRPGLGVPGPLCCAAHPAGALWAPEPLLSIRLPGGASTLESELQEPRASHEGRFQPAWTGAWRSD